MAPAPGQQPPAWWKPVWDLVVEVWVGAILFAMLFTPGVGLDLSVRWLKSSWDVSEFLTGLLTGTKYTVAVVDAVLYVLFILNMAWRFFNELRWRKMDHG